jgi:hypothetical protein
MLYIRKAIFVRKFENSVMLLKQKRKKRNINNTQKQMIPIAE